MYAPSPSLSLAHTRTLSFSPSPFTCTIASRQVASSFSHLSSCNTSGTTCGKHVQMRVPGESMRGKSVGHGSLWYTSETQLQGNGSTRDPLQPAPLLLSCLTAPRRPFSVGLVEGNLANCRWTGQWQRTKEGRTRAVLAAWLTSFSKSVASVRAGTLPLPSSGRIAPDCACTRCRPTRPELRYPNASRHRPRRYCCSRGAALIMMMLRPPRKALLVLPDSTTLPATHTE